MVINITRFKIPGSGFIIAASKYPSMMMYVCCVFFPFILDIKFVGRPSRGHINKEIIQYTSVLFTQAPIRVCLGTNIDSRTILVTMYYCG